MFDNKDDMSDEDYLNSLADEDDILEDDNDSLDDEEDNDDDYLNSLADDAVDNFMRVSDDIDSDEDGVINFPDDTKLKYKHKVNKPLLLIGVVMILAIVFVNKFQSNGATRSDNLHVNSLEDYTEPEYTVDKNTASTYEFVDEDDANYVEPVEGEHLTGLPVIVTTEVDAYFRDSVDMLKVALSVDTFIAENDVYSNKDMAMTLAKLVEEFDDKCSGFNEHNVPEGCEDYDNLVTESISGYTYYFHEVLGATELGTKDEYNSKLSAAVSYVKTKMSGLSESSSKWEYVFIYYGLFNG